MNNQIFLEKILDIVYNQDAVVFSSITDDGYPESRVVVPMEMEGSKNIYFVSTTSTKKIKQVKNNCKTHIYCYNNKVVDFMDSNAFSYRFSGHSEVTDSKEIKKYFWDKKFHAFWDSVDHPDYSIIEFIPIALEASPGNDEKYTCFNIK